MARQHLRWYAAISTILLVYTGLVGVAYAIGPSHPAVIRTTCQFVASGEGRAADGDSSTFNILVLGPPPWASVEYTDRGPTSPLQLHHVKISTISCNSGATATTVIGTATRGAESNKTVGFQIDLGIQSGTATSATVRLRLTDGYDSGAESLSVGTVTIKHEHLKRHVVVGGPTSP